MLFALLRAPTVPGGTSDQDRNLVINTGEIAAVGVHRWLSLPWPFVMDGGYHSSSSAFTITNSVGRANMHKTVLNQNQGQPTREQIRSENEKKGGKT